MIAAGHTSVGVLVGVGTLTLFPALPYPYHLTLVLAVGLISHYLFDLVPHGHYNFDGQNPTFRSKVFFFIDFFIPIGLFSVLAFLTYGFSWPLLVVWAGITGAQAPDILFGLRASRLVSETFWTREQAFHQWTHWHNPTDLRKATNEGGLKLSIYDIWQMIVFLMAIWVVLP
jgi:hypothetical protein